MTATRSVRTAMGFVALLLVPVAWVFTLDAVPSLADTRASHTADIVGVWAFTWSLTWVATICAIGLAWMCWSLNRQETREAPEARADAA